MLVQAYLSQVCKTLEDMKEDMNQMRQDLQELVVESHAMAKAITCMERRQDESTMLEGQHVFLLSVVCVCECVCSLCV